MKKGIFITLILLVAGIIGYHFFAANEAEKEIDRLIQEVVGGMGPASVQYSSIEVSPFNGDILFRDVSFLEQSNIERAQQVLFDFSYGNFLSIYFNGVEDGLKNIDEGNVVFSKLSHLNRSSMQEVAIDSATVTYEGNLWDAFQSLFTGMATEYAHTITMSGTGGRYKKPNSAVGAFKTDSVHVHSNLPVGTNKWQRDGVHDIMITGIAWTPPTTVRNNFGFIIQGLGYTLDAIPIDSLGATYTMPAPTSVELTNGIAATDIFDARFNGRIRSESNWNNARFAPLHISLAELSENFSTILRNIEQLFGISLPRNATNDMIEFQLQGAITNPRLQKNNP